MNGNFENSKIDLSKKLLNVIMRKQLALYFQYAIAIGETSYPSNPKCGM